MEKLIVENEKFNTIKEMFSLENDFAIIAGPCSIESEKQTDYIANKIKKWGLQYYVVVHINLEPHPMLFKVCKKKA